jgi:hypothetical protein
MLVLSASTAWVPVAAAPGDGAPVDAPTLTLADMGDPAPLAFYGQSGTAL